MPESKRRELIVVADDDATIRANLSLLLREEGYEVHEAADGREALKALKDIRVVLALLDLKMPHVDGMQAPADES